MHTNKKKLSKQFKTTKKISSNPTEPYPDETNKLVSLFQQGNFTEAETLARSLVKRFPQNSLSWKVLGAIHRHHGSLEEALSAMEVAIRYMPKDFICLRNIAVLLCDLGRYAKAENYCRKALAINSSYADAYNTLSIVFRSQKKFLEAENSCRRALELKPDFVEAWVNLGLVLNEEGNYFEAESCYLKAIALNPGFAEAFCSLSITLQLSNRIVEAEAYCRRAIEFKPNYAEAYNSLGGILSEQGRYEEAESAYRRALEINPSYIEAWHFLGRTLQKQKLLTAAEACYLRVLNYDPAHAVAYYDLGNNLEEQERHNEAGASYQAAVTIEPNYVDAWINWGKALQAQGLITEAEKSYRKALQIHPDYPEIYNNMGLILQAQGRHAESEDFFRATLQSKPDYNEVFSNLLFLLNYHPGKSSDEIFQEYKKFDEAFCHSLRTEWQPHTNSRIMNRRLKIGYVSPRFCQHSVCNFLEPLLACHDKECVELYAYAEISKEDAVTERYRSYVEHWIPTQDMTDGAMAERIRSDVIDILVDLAGHTGQNRLLVFARKPAPIALHWLDFGYTTGLTAIDYYLTDDASAPTGSERLFSETPWRIRTPSLVYRPKEGVGEVNALPAIERGHVTFGTLTRAVRINHRTIRVWAEILKRVQGSRLVINSGNFHDPAMQIELADKFAAHGIAQNRLEIGYDSPPWDVLRGIDIGLDCFPHNSGTTLIETLYMGIPFVTLADRPSVGRLGCSILEGTGHPEWIAESEEEYIDRAIGLAADLPKLATLRTSLRQDIEKSPLMDEPAFARKVEAAYKEMFAKWCEEQQ